MSAEHKQALYEQLARLTRAMAHPARLQILDLLLQAPRTVEVLAKEIGMSVAATSQHLQVLRTARLVETEKKGLYVTYRLADEAMYDLMRNLRTVAEHRLAEVEQLVRQSREGRDYPEQMPWGELFEKLQSGDVVIVDVRPTEEFRAGHVPGAIGIPLKELESRLEELPHDRDIVTYCRGTYCLLALQAVEILRKHGYRVTYLQEGVRELERAGVELERAEAQ
jgi:rhodanese-related sulfurtransferase/DNA-binding transcriptional ArsR family regulator